MTIQALTNEYNTGLDAAVRVKARCDDLSRAIEDYFKLCPKPEVPRLSALISDAPHTCIILDFPREILLNIGSYLAFYDIVRLSMTCKTLHRELQEASYPLTSNAIIITRIGLFSNSSNKNVMIRLSDVRCITGKAPDAEIKVKEISKVLRKS